ncbi:MAG: hypothetical protein HC897_13445, partial [Thermoanaerobaculia bacterium]|nr:hypothetical protein [Thermoanaerobaculia bacterium]
RAREAREQERLERLEAARRAIRELAPAEPTLLAVYLFGSVLQPGRFHESSDVDVAVDSDDPAAESRFWGALEARLECNVDVRPRTGTVAFAVETSGEKVYEREVAAARS